MLWGQSQRLRDTHGVRLGARKGGLVRGLESCFLPARPTKHMQGNRGGAKVAGKWLVPLNWAPALSPTGDPEDSGGAVS